MADIVKILADIDEVYEKEELKLKNGAHKYDKIKVYLCDIATKQIEPNLNISKDDLIICRFGVGANSGNLFPNSQFLSKDINKDEAKFIRGILKSISNLLSFFEPSIVEKDAILSILSSINEEYFAGIIDEIKGLDELKNEKGKKVATFFSLSYDGKPVSAYFKQIFENHISVKEQKSSYGYDILTNEKGIGGDANLAFCSVNEMPTNMQFIKSKLLPLSANSAKKVENGFKAIKDKLSHNFYGMKIAILPTILSSSVNLEEIVKILEETSKNDIKNIEIAEEAIKFSIDYYLEATAKKQENLPVLNTILFYTQSNAAIDLKLAIDDVLPSFISRISNLMSRFNIKAFYEKNSGTDETIYLQNLFESRLGVMSFLLSRNKFDLGIMIERYSDLIYYGSVNKSYAKKLEWNKYFNDFYKERKFENIAKYQNFFNEINVLNKKLVFQKECDLENLNDKKELIKELIKNSEFLNQNDALISAYLLGMLSAALINWQLGVNGGVSFSNWLNDCGSISMENLERIWTKCDEMIRKLKAASGKPNPNIENIKECLIEILPQVFSNERKMVKTSHTTLAFAMGGSDYRKFIKEKTK
ncbi:MAG: TM1802 family CRISPR-associated protein [Campylobacter concisus]|nr:TM1802 family CRISPR-associated protein [Campylobacter concisus]